MYYNTYQFQGREPYHYGLQVYAEAAAEPVTVAEMKTHSRVDISTDDTKIGQLIKAARAWVENYIGRRLYTQTWDLFLDYFPRNDEIHLPYGPWQSIASIAYLDTSGVSQTLATTVYGLDTTRIEPRLYLKFGQVWPSERTIQNAVTIRYVAGYGTTVPENFKLAIMLLAAHWYEVRSDSDAMKLEEIPQGVRSLLSQEKQSWL